MSSTRAPTLSEAIRTHVDGALAEVHTMIPAVVTEYDAATQRVSVQPLVKRFVTLPDDSTEVRSYPVQSNLPVQFMSGGAFMLTCPISDGITPLGELGTIPATLGSIVVAEASLDVWKTGQGQGQEVDPVFNERFQLKDAVFVPGLRPFGNPLAGVPSDHAFAGAPAGLGLNFHPAVLTVATVADDVANAANFVALANLVLSELQRIQTALSGHTHAYLLAAGTNAPATTGPSDTFTPASVAATNLKST